jgi:hypothetical protein
MSQIRSFVVLAALRRRLPLFATCFAVLFSALSGAQYLLTSFLTRSSIHGQLERDADQVVQQINYHDHWDLKEYRQSADIWAASFYVISADGTVIETKGFLPGLIDKVIIPDQSVFAEPKTVETATHETWRLYGRKLQGGVLLLGILDLQQVSSPDDLLRSTAVRFGSTLDEALHVRSGQTPVEVDYTIIDDAGRLLFAAEGLPVAVTPEAFARLSSLRGKQQFGGKSYAVASRSIVDSTGERVGTVLVPKDITGEERVLGRQRALIIAGGAISWIAAVVAIGISLSVEEWRRRPQAATLSEALKNGECQRIEFKHGLADEQLATAIAAFSNTNSGTIFLGVGDNCTVAGVDCDSPTKRDRELKRIREITTQVIKPAVSVSVDFLEHDGRTVVRIFVPRGDQPLYFLRHEILVREQTSSMRASPEQVQKILKAYHR